jgi:hypothetical protein
MKFSYKMFRTGSDTLLAIADFSILGKTYSEGDIEIEVKNDFYFDNVCNEDEIKKIINKVTIVNAVGKDIIAILIKNKIIDENHVLYINGMPHAQIMTIR